LWGRHLEEYLRWSSLDLSPFEWADTVDGIVPVVALVEGPALLEDITVVVLVTGRPMVLALSWWVGLDLSHLKWAGTVDGIVVVTALVKSPALLIDITVMLVITHGPMVLALTPHGVGFLNLDKGFLADETLLGVLLLLLGDSSLDGGLLEEGGTTSGWSGLDLSHLEWADTVDGIVPIAALVEGPALGVDITVLVLVAWVPVVVTFSHHNLRLGHDFLLADGSSEGHEGHE